jgi:hypothetical protein
MRRPRLSVRSAPDRRERANANGAIDSYILSLATLQVHHCVAMQRDTGDAADRPNLRDKRCNIVRRYYGEVVNIGIAR